MTIFLFHYICRTKIKWNKFENGNRLGLLDAVTKGLLSDEAVISARVLAINVTNGVLGTAVWWSKNISGLGEPHHVEEDGIQIGMKPSNQYPW